MSRPRRQLSRLGGLLRVQDRLGDHRRGDLDLPRARAQTSELLGDRVLHVGRVGRHGRLPQHPAQVVGRQQVLDRHAALLGERRDQRARRGQARRRHRVALGPHPRAPAGRRSGSSAGAARCRAAPRRRTEGGEPLVGVAARAAAVEARGVEQRGGVGGHRVGGRDQRGVGDQPPGRGVALRGDLVACGPELAYGGQGAPALGLVDARTYAATGPVAAAGRGRSGARTPPAAQPSLPDSTSSAAITSRSSTSTSTSRAAYSSHGCGSGRVDQSTAECSLRIERPRITSTSVARPTRG